MPELQLDIEVDGLQMPTFTVWPEGDGPFPAVVFYMDAPGIREELYDMARRISEDGGYYVILPDLFYRSGQLRFKHRSPLTVSIWRQAMQNMTNGDVMTDTKAMLDYMDGLNHVSKGPKASIGYCMSGRLITAAAGTFPEVFAANASLYGVAIVTDKEDSSHYLVKNIKGEMYYGFAETDATVPSYVIPTLIKELDDHGIDYTLDVHPGTNHGFCFPKRDAYDHAAAEKVHAHFMDMCKRHLS